MPPDPGAVTALLERVRLGSAEARNELITLLYDDFLQRAHHQLKHERPGHSLGTGDLTNEALVRLWENDEFAKATDINQLYRAFARAMRQTLVDHARRRNAVKRGGRRREQLDELMEDVRQSYRADVLSLHEALEALGRDYPRHAQVLEMRIFGCYEMAEIAEALGVSLTTVEWDNKFGRHWLYDFLSPESPS